MVLEAAAAETDSWKLFLEVIGAAGGLAGVVAVILHFTHSADAVEPWVGEDQEYRRELAEELRGNRLAGLYQHMLVTSLDWLDRRFGLAESSGALGICFVIALYYAYAAFFLAWGIGGPGDVAGVLFVPEINTWQNRFPDALALVGLPPTAFLVGWWLARLEKHLKRGSFLQGKLSQPTFDITYRGVSAAIILTTFAVTSYVWDRRVVAAAFIALGWIVLAPVVGVIAATRVRANLLKGLLGASAGFLAVAISLAVTQAGGFFGGVVTAGAMGGAAIVAFATARTQGISLAAAAAVAGAAATAIAVPLLELSPTVVLEIAEFKLGAGASAVAIAVEGPLAAALASAAAGAIGAVFGSGGHQGAFSGWLGGLNCVGVFALLHLPARGAHEFVVVLFIFFLILPLVNGIWDWISWWVSRQLGRELLRELRPSRSAYQRAMLIGWHALLDLLAGVLLLAAMAYLMALGFAAYNQVALTLGSGFGSPYGPFQLERFLERAAAAPWTDGLWLTVMLIRRWSRHSCT